MIQINYNIELPKNCNDCPLSDGEMFYCHGRLIFDSERELIDYFYNGGKPEWCPLIEVKNET